MKNDANLHETLIQIQMFLKPFTKTAQFYLFTLSIILFSNVCKAQLNIKSIWKEYQFVPERFEEIVWKKENGFAFLKNDTIFSKSFQNEQSVLFSISDLQKSDSSISGLSNFSFSTSEKFTLLETDPNSIYRHSQTANYFILNNQTNEIQKIDSTQIQIPTFSSDEKNVVFFHQNNLYIYSIVNKEIEPITSNGKYNAIINGKTDWVHEEEFGFTKAYEISPNSKNLVYIQYNESRVREYPLLFWKKDNYPELFSYKYPKAGEKNAITSLFLYDFDNKKTLKLFDNEKTDYYYPFLNWFDSETILYIELDRLQKNLSFIKLNIHSLQTDTIYKEKNDKYIELPTVFIKDKIVYFTSEKDGRNAIYRLEEKNNTRLTSLDYDIENFYDVNPEKQEIYFSRAFGFTSQVCVQNTEGKIVVLSSAKKTGVLNLSPSFKEYIITESSSQDVPTTIWIKESKSDTLISNAPLKSKLQALNLPKTEFFTFVNSHGDSLDAWILKPEKISKKQKLPVLIYFYGGPGFRAAVSKYNATDHFWYQELVKKGYVVACIDPRGSGGKGTYFKKQTYEKLGLLESEDINDFAKFLQKKPFVDSTRIGIWGWSYGGFLTTLCLNRFPNTFKTGIAVAAVTHWKYYDNIYTERYMNTPENNPDGYNLTSPMYYADRLKAKLLLIHGSTDDNVHPQHFYEYENILINKGKHFEQFLYPNRNHGIYGGNTRLHLFELMSNFILRNL